MARKEEGMCESTENERDLNYALNMRLNEK